MSQVSFFWFLFFLMETIQKPELSQNQIRTRLEPELCGQTNSFRSTCRVSSRTPLKRRWFEKLIKDQSSPSSSSTSAAAAAEPGPWWELDQILHRIHGPKEPTWRRVKPPRVRIRAREKSKKDPNRPGSMCPLSSESGPDDSGGSQPGPGPWVRLRTELKKLPGVSLFRRGGVRCVRVCVCVCVCVFTHSLTLSLQIWAGSGWFWFRFWIRVSAEDSQTFRPASACVLGGGGGGGVATGRATLRCFPSSSRPDVCLVSSQNICPNTHDNPEESTRDQTRNRFHWFLFVLYCHLQDIPEVLHICSGLDQIFWTWSLSSRTQQISVQSKKNTEESFK